MFNNEFTCPDGHTFKANAKLRARCNECGKMARRAYNQAAPSPDPVVTGGEVPPEPPVTTASNDGGLKLIRRGKPKVMPKKTTPPRVNGRFVSVKKKATVKKPTTQLVTKKTVSAGTKKKPTMPRVTKKPPRTAVARHVAGGGGKQSYADEMINNYGFRR